MSKRHVAHIVYRFATGGLENGIVNLINRLPADEYRHSIICLDGHDPEFAARLQPAVQIENIAKRPGGDWKYYAAMWKLLRRLRPDVVHTRNMTTMEYHIPAMLAGVPRRIHGEHGWDMTDLHGNNARFRQLKRALKPLVHDFVALSSQSADYLIEKVGVNRRCCHQIINGVDTARFTPRGPKAPTPEGFLDDDCVVFGCVGRLATVKNHRLLADSFISLTRQSPALAPRLRLIIVGDGDHYPSLQRQFKEAAVSHQVWMPGNRQDIPDLMRLFDLFVLPSLGEGISNTILEAFASGLPVIATRVGGNPELIDEGRTGALVDCTAESLTAAMTAYAQAPETLEEQGATARQSALDRFSLEAMVASYSSLYQAP